MHNHKEHQLITPARPFSDRPHSLRGHALASRAAALCLALVLALAVFGCGEKNESTAGKKLKKNRITLLLDWSPNADHAGIYTGLAKGTFDRQGIALEPQVPSDPSAVIKQVAAGRADLGVSYQNEVMEARDEGVKVKAIATIVNRPLNSLIWLNKSGIKSIKDLKGKKVGTSGAYPSTFLHVILDKAGLKPGDVDEVDVGWDLLPHLLAGKVDAIIGAYYNVEGVQLKIKDRPATITPVDKAGAPTYDELVVIASEEFLKDGGRAESFRRFLAGLRDGTQAAIADPKLAGDSLAAKVDDLAKDRDTLDASLKMTLPVLKSAEGKPYGWMDPLTWTNFANFMRDQELLKHAPSPVDAYSNDYLPGNGPAK
ncbi:MAG: ABC transporter substrate-binding protein [Actinobacteria bacterium]|nr:ABC transporter substrate-binding protein [Actinomycetota bacterium]